MSSHCLFGGRTISETFAVWQRVGVVFDHVVGLAIFHQGDALSSVTAVPILALLGGLSHRDA